MLVAGVAHDFNNILTVISNGIALAKREVARDTASVEHLDAVALAAERASDLCRQMLAYTGKARLERERVDLSDLVDEMSKILEASIAKKATLVRELPPGLPTLLADPTQLRQVVMNLVLNAPRRRRPASSARLARRWRAWRTDGNVEDTSMCPKAGSSR